VHKTSEMLALHMKCIKCTQNMNPKSRSKKRLCQSRGIRPLTIQAKKALLYSELLGSGICRAWIHIAAAFGSVRTSNHYRILQHFTSIDIMK
jgi:hypothetical protein